MKIMKLLPLFRLSCRGMKTQDIINFAKNHEATFQGVLKKTNIIKAEDGQCIAELKIEKEHTNAIGGLHGGLVFTLIDALTAYATKTKNSLGKGIVSIDIHVSYLNTAKLGDEILINASTIKAGKTISFSECIITNKATGDIVAKGTHTNSFRIK